MCLVSILSKEKVYYLAKFTNRHFCTQTHCSAMDDFKVEGTKWLMHGTGKIITCLTVLLPKAAAIFSHLLDSISSGG